MSFNTPDFFQILITFYQILMVLANLLLVSFSESLKLFTSNGSGEFALLVRQSAIVKSIFKYNLPFHSLLHTDAEEIPHRAFEQTGKVSTT